MEHNTDGGKTSFYDIFEGCTDVDSVMMKHELTGAEFTILKSLVGVIKGRKEDISRHGSNSALSAKDNAIRDCNKILRYTNLIKDSLEDT